MRILITGGAGFIGHHLVRRLLQDGGNSVTVLDNLRRGNIGNLPAGEIVFHQVDIRDRPALDTAMSGCDVVFHLAAQSNVLGSMQDTDYCFTTNVCGTFQVLQAAREAGVRRVVFTSSREVYGDPEHIPVQESAPLHPKNHYGASKAAAEMYCRTSGYDGLEVAVLRLANVYGPGDKNRVIPLFVEQALLGFPLVLYDGSQVLDFVWIHKVVDALVQTGFGKFFPEPLNIGSGEGITIHKLAERILKLTQSRSQLQVEPKRDAEVTRFVADTRRAQANLRLHALEDPLAGLSEVVKSMTPAAGHSLSQRGPLLGVVRQ